MSIDFFLTALIVVLIPGTGVIYTLAIGLGRGFQASVLAAFGCTLGILPAALASIIGLAAILHTSAVAFQILKYLGVLYLFYMAWKTLKDHEIFEINGSSEARARTPYRRIIINGFLINVLNPKLSLFFLAFLPQFISPSATHPTQELIALAGWFMLMTFGVFIIYGLFASFARDYIINRPSVTRWLKRSFAGVFGVLGVNLALAD